MVNSKCSRDILNPIALRKAKTVYNFGLSGYNWVDKGDETSMW